MTTLLDYLDAAAAPGSAAAEVAVAGTPADADVPLSYPELERRAGTLAADLQQAGAGPGERVGILLEGGTDTVVAVWAVLKTGAAYVPVDPASPAARRDAILARIKPCAVITDGTAAVDGTDTVDVRRARRTPVTPTPVTVRPEDPAYVLHTSGSTGTPKGVVLTHRNATAFADWAVDTFALRATDRVAGHAPIHFDLSTFDLFATAKAGATLLPVPAAARVLPGELAAFLRQAQATVLYCVPSALTMLSRSAPEGSLDGLRTVLFAGEVCPLSTLRRMYELAPQARYANLYGPTETNVCTYHEIGPDDLDRPALPIGRPITPETLVTVMASPEREAEPGEPGELYVCGPTVALGYWDDPAQTAQRFTSRRSADGRAYRTGDIVVRDPDGLLQFRGRLDRQVKTRGHRVELDEVEGVLRSHPAVGEAAVLAVPDEAISNRLVAAVVTSRPTTPAQLRRVCAASLPSYALPMIHVVRALPRTSNGKVDRDALAATLASGAREEPR
ncbi:MAG: amino acid adenylation domain-containing protein [Micromonosporaceae bacterium]